MGNFYTDVVKNNPHFESISLVSDINPLESVTRSRVAAIIEDAKAHGLELMVFETYRSQVRQTRLFNKGATKLKTVGVHHYGLACDIVKSIDGKPSWKGDSSVLGELAHAHGLIWGGDWGSPDAHHSFIDSVHVQRGCIAKQAALFRGEWYPDENYNSYD